MKKIIIVVEFCNECPFLHYEEIGYSCREPYLSTGKELEDRVLALSSPILIPQWCPLEEV